MLAQSKNVFQAEIDAACELIDFFKFNAEYVTQLYGEQPESAAGTEQTRTPTTRRFCFGHYTF